MEMPVYNRNGKEVSKLKLPREIFGLPMNFDLTHQIIVSQSANRRQRIAHSKDRGDVRGGGKKPWQQKGTGRARVGSNRSPLWRGGGITFGPRNEKNYKKNISKKMRRKALLMILSEKAKNKLLILLDNLKIQEVKTKVIFNILGKLPCKGKSCLIILPEYDKNVILSVRNIQKTSVAQAKDINPLDLLSFKYLLMPKNSVEIIKKTFAK